MRRFTASIALGLGWLVVLTGARDQDPQRPPVFRSGIDLVQVDVSVLDADRRPVRGLAASDFSVLEDGKLQEIVTFSEVSVPEADDSAAAWTRDVAHDVVTNNSEDGRLFVLLVDDAMIPSGLRTPELIATVRRISAAIIDRLGPSDLVAVIYTLDNRANQNFTNDPARLRAAIEKFRPGYFPIGPFVAGTNNAGSAGGASEIFPRYSADTLGKVANYLADVPHRRKALVYVSYGFTLKPFQSSQTSSGEAMVTLHAQDALERAQRANVTIYGINPNGLGRQDIDADAGAPAPVPDSFFRRVPDDPATYRPFLQLAASTTGGFTIARTTEFVPGIAQLFRETGSYYLLGYRSSNQKTDGRFRALDVRVGRSDLLVRARNGYYGARPPKPPDPDDRPLPPLDLAISGLLPAKGIPLRASIAPFAVPGQREAAVLIALGLRRPASTVPLVEDVSLLTEAFTTKGDRRGSRRMTARLSLRGNGAGEARYEVLSRIDLPPGRYELRLAAHSASQEKSGSLYVYVDVPDFEEDPLSLSGIMLSATPGLTVAPRDALATLIPIVPTALREFSGQQVTAFVRVYQGGKAAVVGTSVAVRLVDAANDEVFADTETLGLERFATNRSADYRIDLPAALLTTGQYLLSIKTTARTSAAQRDARFTVR